MTQAEQMVFLSNPEYGVSLQPAEKFAVALVHGEPNRTKIVTIVTSDEVHGLI